MESPIISDHQWISRCFDLAKRGIGYVSPNPPVGAILIHDNMIIGEGYHAFFGGPHAEVMAFENVPENKRHLIAESTLYVSLEPCSIHGKTPPCTDLIIREGVKDVRISTVDPNPKIAGEGVRILQKHGIHVTNSILEQQGRDLIRMFRTNILLKRPYVILKWAQSQKGYVGSKKERIILSHPYTTTWSHGLRAVADVIMVGARTVIIDNPKLNTRDAPGRSPHRAVYDPNGILTREYYVFDPDEKHIFYFSRKENPNVSETHILQMRLDDASPHTDQILHYLFSHQMGILLVEGGAHLLSLFISENNWDEGWVIRTKHSLEEGIVAPRIKGKLIDQFESATDTIVGIRNEKKQND